MKSLSYSAVFPIILSDDKSKILLHKRKNTGYCDGFWDTAASGHVDVGESAKSAAIRECAEEIAIEVTADDLEFVHMSHNTYEDDKSYYHIYFLVNEYQGKPTINEPKKAEELDWFDLDALPEMVPARKIAIEAWKDNISYIEIWN